MKAMKHNRFMILSNMPKYTLPLQIQCPRPETLRSTKLTINKLCGSRTIIIVGGMSTLFGQIFRAKGSRQSRIPEQFIMSEIQASSFILYYILRPQPPSFIASCPCIQIWTFLSAAPWTIQKLSGDIIHSAKARVLNADIDDNRNTPRCNDRRVAKGPICTCRNDKQTIRKVTNVVSVCLYF